MIYVTTIIFVLTGLSVLLFGLRLMTENLKELAGTKLEGFLKRTATSRTSAAAAGAGITALIHSSTATTVMAVSFVGAGLMSLFQAGAIIIGANVGTTVTGLLVALESLDISLFLLLFAVVGVIIISFTKKKRLGYALCGVGFVFLGLRVLATASEGEGGIRLALILGNVSNPFVLLLLGALITALTQSSTAVNSILILLTVPYGGQGLDIIDAIYVILGTNIGTCLTALFVSLGSSVEAKRASMLHLIFNALSAVLFLLIILPIPPHLLAKLLSTLFSSNAKFQLAWFNFFQNLVSAALALPFLKQLVGLSERIIKG